MNKDSIAVITGGSSGMGLACAHRLGRHHALVLADVNEAGLAVATAELRAAGYAVTPQLVDVTQPESVAKLAETVRSLGRFAALVHSAGLSPTMSDWRRIIEVNLVGTALVERAFLPLAEQGSAAVLISSMSAHTKPATKRNEPILSRPLADDFWPTMEADPDAPTHAYMLSKRGVLLYCEAMAPEWGARGARITTISPGIIETPMGQREFEKQPSMARMIDMSPINRWGRADEIAAAAEFLVSDAASFITGTDLRVDGGAIPVMNKMMP